MGKPLVSIIVPVYNVENYLGKCLDSIINQTLRDIEIICVNDGTKDNSVAILDEYAAKDTRIKIIHKENGGLSAARNEGLKHATADLIGFVDSDDWIESDTYEAAYKEMVSNNVDLVCWYARIEQEGNSLNQNDITNAKEYHKIKNTGLYYVTDKMFMDCTVTIWNKLFKKSLLDEYDISFPVGFLHEDDEFFLKYALVCKTVFFINRYLYHYLQRTNSIMWNKTKTQNKISTYKINIMGNLYRFFVKHNIISKYKTTISFYFYLFFNSDCWANSKRNRLLVFHHAARIVKNFDLSLLDDPENILSDLKHKKYSRLFWNFIVKETIFYRILRKLYHKTNFYEIKVLRQKTNDTNNMLWRHDILERRIVNDLIGIGQEGLINNFAANGEPAGAYQRYGGILNLSTQITAKNSFADFGEFTAEAPVFAGRTNHSFDNKEIIAELKSLGKFLFCPNNGNLGDVIIAEAEYQFFKSLELDYKTLDIYNGCVIEQTFQYSSFVYGGGGLFVGLYDYRIIKEVFERQHLNRIIILPSSFENCDELLEIFDERFVVFCREEKSLRYCAGKNNKAKFLLANDMAFYLDAKLFCPDTAAAKNSIARFDENHSMMLYETWARFSVTCNDIKKAANEKTLFLKDGKKICFVLRTDEESNIKEDENGRYAGDTFDLSSFGFISCTDSGLAKALSLLVIHTLNYFDVIVTDRLHMGIVSTLLGKDVYLLDNSYGKLSGVYKQSMTGYANVKIIKSISQFLKETDNTIRQKNPGAEYAPYDVKITFKDFLAVYFSAHNPGSAAGNFL